MLELLLCFDYTNGFQEMLDENKIRTIPPHTYGNVFEKEAYRDYLKWEETISLNSLLMMYHSPHYHIKSLYQLTIDQDSKIIYFPEGLVSIDFNKLIYSTDPFLAVKKIREDEHKNIIVLPNSMKSITGKLLNNKFIEVCLNDGLEVIGDEVFHGFVGDNIHIPDSVRSIGKNAFGVLNRTKPIHSITFDSSKSRLLNNKENLKEFLQDFFTGYDENDCYYFTFSDQTKNKKNIIIPWFYNIYIADIDLTITGYELYQPFLISCFNKQIPNHMHYKIVDSSYSSELIIDINDSDKTYTIKRITPEYYKISRVMTVDFDEEYSKFKDDYKQYKMDEIIEKIYSKIKDKEKVKKL